MVIKLIISDLAGVLTENGDILLFEQLQELFPNKPFKKMEEVFSKHMLLAERGEVSEWDFLHAFLEEMSLDSQDVDKIQQLRRDATKTNPEMISFIKKLRMAGYKLGYATNCSEEEIIHNEKVLGLSGLFDFGLASCDTKCRKTDPEIFRKIVGHFEGVKFEEVVYMDDNVKYVGVAKELGIHAIHFKSLEQAKIELQKLGVDV